MQKNIYLVDLEKYYNSTSLVKEIAYPLENKLDSPKSINIKKLKEFEGKLIGIKGQYLIFEDQSVFNVRSNEGLVIEMELLNFYFLIYFQIKLFSKKINT